MPSKTVTISSDDKLEEQIKNFCEEYGQTRAEFHRRSSYLYMNNERMKRRPKGE